MTQTISRIGAFIALAIIAVSTSAFEFYRTKLVQVRNVNIAIEQLPMNLGQWKGQELEGLGLVSRDILRLDHYVRRIYQNDLGEQVFVYVGYWNKQSGEHQAAKHSPSVCLPSNGWRVSQEQPELFDAGSGPLKTNRLVGEIDNKQQVFYYWFFSGERSYNQEWYALLNISLESFFHGRSDGGIIEISTPLSVSGKDLSLEQTHQTTQKFLRDFYPPLAALIHSPQPVN